MEQAKGYSIIAEELHRAGLRTIFGVMGEANLDVLAYSTEKLATRYFAARHEAGAIAMAEGFARATGEVGCATVTYGPGIANAVTAITSAARNRSSILVFTAEVPSHVTRSNQRLDHRKLLAATGAAVVHIDQAGHLGSATQRALELIRRHRRPAVVNVMSPILDGVAAVGDVSSNEAAEKANPPPDGISWDERGLAEFIGALRGAERPAIIAGLGAILSGAIPGLITIADHFNAGLLTSLLARGAFEGNPRNLGVAGGFGWATGREALKRSDVVASFGASLNEWTTRGGHAFPNARVLQCDADATAFDRSSVRPTISLHADAQIAASRIVREIESGRAPLVRKANNVWWERIDEDALHPACLAPDLLDPRAFCLSLNLLLPESRTIVVDAGHFFEFPSKYLSVPDHRGFFFTAGFGCVGLGMSAAIGTAIGRPDRLSVAVVGDGGFMMSLPELETAVRYDLPMLIVIFNDGGYGAEAKQLERRGWQPSLALFRNPDFAKLSTAAGATGISVNKLTDLELLKPSLGEIRGPIVLDVKIDPSVTGEWVTQAYGS